MMHLNEKLAEYVYEELSAAEIAEARRHVAACAECKARVEEFERIHHALKAMPDVDLPRRVVIAPAAQARPRVFVPLRWLAPIGAAAALVLMLAVVGPIHAEWRDSQLTIAFGKLPAPLSPAAGAVSPALVTQPIDYQRIADTVRAQQQVWLAQEVARLETKLAAVNGKELNHVRSQLDFLEKWQQETWRGKEEITSSIQLLARASEK